MKVTKFLSGLLIAAVAALGGCYGSAGYSSSGGGYYAGAVIYDPPPAPRIVVTPAPRAGFVYVQGRWVRNHNRWAWRDGYYERERVGYYYAPGRWQRRNAGGYVWVDGRWSARNNRDRNSNRRNNRVIIRNRY